MKLRSFTPGNIKRKAASLLGGYFKRGANTGMNTLIGRDLTHDDAWKPPPKSMDNYFAAMPHTTEPLAPDHNTMPDCVVIGDFYELSRKYLRLNDISGGKMLEIGGSIARNGMKQFPEFDYLNVDLLDNDEIHTLVADITDCKDTIESESMDFVFSMHVLEHIAEPWKVAEEITRILKPGGLTVTVTFWAWRYHPTPIDYWRYSSECLKFLFKETECLEANFDSSCRRTTRQGKWPNKADSVPVDERGGWLESWNVYHVGRKPLT